MPEIASPLFINDTVVKRVKALIEQQNNPQLKLRVSVSGGGCSGFQYDFELDEAVNDDDISVSKEGVTVLVDPTSLQFIAGSEVNFTEGLGGSQFVINNPNAASTCGCGTSFSI